MEIFIGHKSALEYWRRQEGGAQGSRGRRLRGKELPGKPLDAVALQRAASLGLSLPVDVMVSEQSARRASRASQTVRHRVYGGPVPDGSFWSVGNGVIVSSPELCFFQMASELPFVKLIELGFELCGSYSLPPVLATPPAPVALPAPTAPVAPTASPTSSASSAPVTPTVPSTLTISEILSAFSSPEISSGSMTPLAPATLPTPSVPATPPAPLISATAKTSATSRPPLTSTKKLRAFVARMKGVRGQKQAARALRYIVDGSASPMETVLTMLLTLPPLLGGYRFPLPILNGRIVPGKSAKASSSKSYYSCDLFWPDLDLAVEYDSDHFHTGAERIASDSKRRNSLALIGIVVITVTSRQIRSIVEFEKVARQIAGNMDRRLQVKSPQFLKAQRELRGHLL